MKKSSGFTLRIALIICDALTIIFSFAAAYFFRTHLSSRPFYFESHFSDFVMSIFLFLPIWLIILAALGLYKKSIFLGKSKFPEFCRVFLAATLGTMGLISIDFFFNLDLFPVRTIVLLATVFCFILMIILRLALRLVRKKILQKSHRGMLKAVIIGNNKNTTRLAEYIHDYPESGYRVTGIVADPKYSESLSEKIHRYSSLEEAFRKVRPDVIFQTDRHNTEGVYAKSLDHYTPYYFVPNETTLSSQLGDLELIGNTPAILVKVTPLAGGGRIVKRLADIIISLVAIILAFIPMLILYIILKISDPKHPVFFSQPRLSLNGREFKMYKFRTMKFEYSGMTAKEAFEKMGKPELIHLYRSNGDFLDNDPRITKIGKILRNTSIDELPQFFNVLKGDISFIGPRALLANETRNYGDRSLLLSVKSGMTGLAQVSGRRDISFEERRALDIYYIKNWSIFLDIQILFKTIAVVFKREGAK